MIASGRSFHACCQAAASSAAGRWSWPGPGSTRSRRSRVTWGSPSRACAGWIKADDIETGRAEGLTRDERAELVQLRRQTRVQAMEIEILKRASALFARENVLPK